MDVEAVHDEQMGQAVVVVVVLLLLLLLLFLKLYGGRRRRFRGSQLFRRHPGGRRGRRMCPALGSGRVRRGGTCSRAPIRAAPQLLQAALVDHLGHAVKVHQQTQKDLVRRRTVLVDAAQVAEDRDAGHVLAVERQDARGLGTQAGGAVGRRDVSMHMLVVHVVGGRDLGQQARDHLDDVRHRHGADLELAFLTRSPGPLRLRQELLAGEAVDVREVAHLDLAGRGGLGAAQRPGRAVGGLEARGRRRGAGPGRRNRGRGDPRLAGPLGML